MLMVCFRHSDCSLKESARVGWNVEGRYAVFGGVGTTLRPGASEVSAIRMPDVPVFPVVVGYPARIIHERFCCHRGFAVATSLARH